MMRGIMANGMVFGERNRSTAPATANITVTKAVMRTVVAVASPGLMGASPQTGQTLRKSGGHWSGAKTGAQR